MSKVLAKLSEIDWSPATSNADGSAIADGEITGYAIGVRPATGSKGTYPFTLTAPGDAVKAMAAAISGLLPTDTDLVAAVQSTGPVASDWAESDAFQIQAPAPVPNPPSAVSVA